MNGVVKKVFILLGTLVLIFIIWQLVFNEGGILRTAYNAMATGINNQFAKVAGKGQTILPLWSTDTVDVNGEGFQIDTQK